MTTDKGDRAAPDDHPVSARYARQVLFPKIGEDGQRRLSASRVALIGCGALGSALADTLTRAGVGFLRICDRDFVEINNLQRQVLFDEDDVAARIPKAEAASRKLRRINSEVHLEPRIIDVNHANIMGLTADVDLVLDGTDNFETRFLINDLSVSTGKPWIYGAVIGATGLCMPILPGVTACLRCVFDKAPPAEMNPTCDTAGVLGMTVNMTAAMQAVEAMKLLCGRATDLVPRLHHFDLWEGRFVGLKVNRNEACACCGDRAFPYLEGTLASATTSLCGRNAVQVLPPAAGLLDLGALATRLVPVSNEPPLVNEFLVRAQVGAHELTVFADGRAIIKGTDRVDEARSLYARYIGS